MSTQNLTQKLLARNRQPSIKARAFEVAFVPEKTQPNIMKVWSDEASYAIAVLVDFRSAVHRWQAIGKIDEDEFITEVEQLENAGLSGWFDNLIAKAMEAVHER